MVMTSRPITAADWSRAADRAVAEGIRVMQLPTTGVWVASSGSDTDVAYIVTPTGCECRGGQRGSACKHVAALRIKLRMLAAPLPTVEVAPVPSAPARTTTCRECSGSGYARMYTGYRLTDWIAVACSCETGRAMRSRQVA